MSVIATIEVPAVDFALGATLGTSSGMEIRLERIVPLGDTFVPYLWVSNEAVGEIETEFRESPDVASIESVDEVDDVALVRVEWAEGTDGFLDALGRANATVLEGVGEGDSWRFQLRFPDHDRLTEFYHACVDDDIDVDLESVHDPRSLRVDPAEVELTDLQRETLRLALEEGYFDVPRRTNLVDLADEIGVSDTAVSQRLRRGTAALLAATLGDDRDD